MRRDHRHKNLYAFFGLRIIIAVAAAALRVHHLVVVQQLPIRVAAVLPATVYPRDGLTGSQLLLATGTSYQFTLATAASGNGRFSVVLRAAGVVCWPTGRSFRPPR